MAGEVRLGPGERVLAWLAAKVGGGLLRLLFSTCRVEVMDKQTHQRHYDNLYGPRRPRPAVFATWHRGAIFSLYYYGRYQKKASPDRRIGILISRSKDGEYLARFAAGFGLVPVRGSSGHGGGMALREMERRLRSGELVYAATVADGPRGPRYRAKKGMVALAMRVGCPLVPAIWSCDRAWVFRRSWDRTMLPKPFARIKVLYGPELLFPPHMDAEQMEQARLRLEQELNRLREKADALTGYRDPD